MKRLFGISALLVGIGFALTACGTVATSGTGASPAASVAATDSARPYGPPAALATPSPTAPAAIGIPVGVRMTGLGSILVDGRGLSLYLFEADKGSSSVCYGSCAQNWPPLLTHGSPVASGGASSSLLGTTARSDGTTQVTYAGHPLYFFIGDHKPGDTTGEGINAFGGGWDVLAPSGSKIEGGNS